jgi:uncharacterized protein YkwD
MSILKHPQDVFLPRASNNYRPHILREKALSVFAVFFVFVELLGAVKVPATHAESISSANIIRMTNLSRVDYGLRPVYESPALSLAAQAKAEDMVKNQYFSHNSPGGTTPWDFMAKQDYKYIIAGENLAMNFHTSEGVRKAWMNSVGHKANILNADFQDIGIGIVQGEYHGKPATFVVQMFGTPTKQNIRGVNGYTPRAQVLGEETLTLPSATFVALAKPEILFAGHSYTNKEVATVSGTAPDAKLVYVTRNSIPIATTGVVDGKYTLDVKLGEGVNNLQVVSFDGYMKSSPSNEVRVLRDSIAPNAEWTQLIPNGNNEYILEMAIMGDPIKVVATAGLQGVVLTESSEGIWRAVISSQDFTNLQVTFSDLAGNYGVERVATFSVEAFGAEQSTGATSTTGNNLLYPLAITIFMALLFLAVALKPRIQHVRFIAQVSSFIMLLTLLWVT